MPKGYTCNMTRSTYSQEHGKLHKLRTTSNDGFHRSLQQHMPGLSVDDEIVYGYCRDRTGHA
jgi:hypothetical protein